MNKINVQPIRGSWLEFQHLWKVEGKYWDAECAKFSPEKWEHKIEEMAGIGLKYLVLTNVACHGKAYYETSLLPKFPFACDDPIEVSLAAGDKLGIKLFMGIGYFTPCSGRYDRINDPVNVVHRRAAQHDHVQGKGQDDAQHDSRLVESRQELVGRKLLDVSLG